MAFLLAVSVPKHDVVLAAISQPARLGRLRRLYLPDGLALILVRRTDSGFGHAARPSPHSGQADYLRISGHGLAGLGRALEAVRNGFPIARGPGDTTGRLGTHGSEFRFRHRHRAWLAHDHLSSLFRRGCDLLGICHGAVPGDSAA